MPVFLFQRNLKVPSLKREGGDEINNQRVVMIKRSKSSRKARETQRDQDLSSICHPIARSRPADDCFCKSFAPALLTSTRNLKASHVKLAVVCVLARSVPVVFFLTHAFNRRDATTSRTTAHSESERERASGQSSREFMNAASQLHSQSSLHTHERAASAYLA